MTEHKIFKMTFASVYPFYIEKVEKKGRTKAEVDQLICWLTGYDLQSLNKQIDYKVNFETFFTEAPQINPNADKITGWICGIRVQDMEEGLMKQIRWLDKIIDELAKGKAVEKIKRT